MAAEAHTVGADGRLRVSMRHLDEKLSTEDLPAHSFDRVEKLFPGETVDVEIGLLPVGRHIVHTGGDRASYLQLPVKPM
ncbi:CocE/NonD family hydrolase C-terminal non-catalytic domain-containing protein [Streptomyces cyaneofuscatus]|uniref:CocE/NonD family hydrolase C-terminal non-catalytic domain-containing protein n=1 Tax=Streptomyces cyaneofuscatus TaxID=66883 RepID=UPI00364E6A0E